MEKMNIFLFTVISSFSVLINGCPFGFFGGSRGLRQGDPLSSFLFIMVFKVLSRMISRAEMGYISGFKLGREGEVTISHLQFADDTMIFCEANMRQIGFLRCILTCFGAVSGLKINLDKSVLFQVGNVGDIESLAWIPGYKIGYLLSSYLGLPLGATYKSKVIWDPVIEKTSSRLEAWKVPLLSKGGD